MMMGFQEVYKKLLPDALANLDDVYPLFPKLGDENMIQRMNPWNDIEGTLAVTSFWVCVLLLRS